MTTAQDFAQKHQEDFLQQLCDLIRIPSISTLSESKADVQRAADWLVADLKRIGFDHAEAAPTPGHPVVYAEWNGAGPDAPTVLIYGHYDVQPAELEAGWTTDPFEPVIKDGMIYARGSVDDKGQAFAHVKAAESLFNSEAGCPVNLKFIIEGEEEVASEHLVGFIEANIDRLKADVCVISDTGMDSLDQPEITYALRGLTYMELHVSGPSTDLHSGQFGGTVHNPAQALARIIAKLHNENGTITVPGFYDDVLPLGEEERAALNANGIDPEEWKKLSGAPELWGEAEYTLVERIGARPTLEVNGIVGGFYGEGSKTVLPAKAMAKISCRLVANQSAHRIYELVRDYVAEITPPTVRSEVRLLNLGEPAYTDPDMPMMKAAITAYEEAWGHTPIFTRGGGSIPIVSDFQQKLDVPVILMGFGLGGGAHGPNEYFAVEAFNRGVQTSIRFLQEVGKKANA